jgi:four helix bundle protein
MMPYERFSAWQISHRLVLQVYRATRRFPSDERYGLSAQARRAAFSAAASIAEGSARRGSREFRRYLDISLGSLSELSYTLRLAHELDLLTDGEWRDLNELRDHAGRLTWRLSQSLRVAKPRAEP